MAIETIISFEDGEVLGLPFFTFNTLVAID